MAKQHQIGVKAPRNVQLKCPLCGKVHSATEWHNQSLRRWRTIRKLPANKQNCWFECPSCREVSRGIDLIPIVSNGGGEVIGEGWFVYYHTPLEGGVASAESEVPIMRQD